MKKPPAPTVPLPERLGQEPAKWYARFCKWLLQPAGRRSVENVFRDELKAAKGGAGGSVGQQRPGGAWHRAYVAYRWAERASQWDSDVVATEVLELADARKKARMRRAAVVTQFLEEASTLLKLPAVFAAAPAGVSAAVLRAIEASRQEFGADPLPESHEREGGKYIKGALGPVEVRFFCDDGSGNPLPQDQWPIPDTFDPNFDPMTGESTPPSAAPTVTDAPSPN